MKLSLVTASFLVLCTAASAQTVTTETYKQDPACKAAVEQTCPGIKPGGGRIKACLKEHNTTLKQLCPGDVGKKHLHQSAPVTSGTPPVAAPLATPPAGQ